MRKGLFQDWIKEILCLDFGNQPKRKYVIIFTKFMLTLWFAFSDYGLQAQNKQLIDSLTYTLEKEKDLSPIEKVDLYVQIAGEYAKSDSANTHSFVNRAIGIAKGIEYKEGEIDALVCLGTLAIEKGNYPKATSQFEVVIELSEEANYKVGRAKAYRGIGHVKDYSGKYEEAIKYFQQSLELFEAAGKEADVALCISFISGVKRMQGDYSVALEYGLKSLHIYEKLKDTPGIGLITNDVGLIYWHLDDLDKALEFFDASLAIHMQLQDKRSIAYTTANMGIISEEKHDPNQALNYYNISLEMLYELDDKRAQSIILYNMSIVYENIEQYNLSLDHGLKSLKLREELGVESEKCYPLVGIGSTYMAMEQWAMAKTYSLQGYELAQKHGMRPMVHVSLLDLSMIERELGNYKSAYEYHVLYKQAADSLKNEENTKRITRLEAEYDFQKEKDSIQFINQKEILAKNAQIALEKVRLSWAIGIGLLILAVGLVIAWMRIRVNKQKALYLEEIGQFKQALTGMIAHDLKNPLSIILNNKDVEKNQHTAKQMLQLINNMLDVQKFEAARMWLQLQIVNFKTLAESAREQVELLAEQAQVQIKIELPEAQIDLDKEIMERVLVNLLTNAIKYSPANVEVIIQGIIENDKLFVSVTDQGGGIAKSDQEWIFKSFGQRDPKMSGGVGSTGLGLTFCKLAIEAHGSQLQLDSELDRGTTFSFVLEMLSDEGRSSGILQSPKYLTMTNSDKEKIRESAQVLKALNLHQIGEIEKELAALKTKDTKAVHAWVEAVLDAAYIGNEEKFKELLDL